MIRAVIICPHAMSLPRDGSRKSACRVRAAASPAVPPCLVASDVPRKSESRVSGALKARTRTFGGLPVSVPVHRFSRAAQWSTEAAGENQEALKLAHGLGIG